LRLSILTLTDLQGIAVAHLHQAELLVLCSYSNDKNQDAEKNWYYWQSQLPEDSATSQVVSGTYAQIIDNFKAQTGAGKIFTSCFNTFNTEITANPKPSPSVSVEGKMTSTHPIELSSPNIDPCVSNVNQQLAKELKERDKIPSHVQVGNIISKFFFSHLSSSKGHPICCINSTARAKRPEANSTIRD